MNGRITVHITHFPKSNGKLFFIPKKEWWEKINIFEDCLYQKLC